MYFKASLNIVFVRNIDSSFMCSSLYVSMELIANLHDHDLRANYRGKTSG